MKKRILVVDDEELLTKTFARLLEKKGYEVATSTRPEDGIDMVEKNHFDLVLCDIRMPGMNGVDMVRQMMSVLERQGKKRVPVIFLTGFADKKVEDQARTLNPVDYIFKPFDVMKLLDLIEATLKS